MCITDASKRIQLIPAGSMQMDSDVLAWCYWVPPPKAYLLATRRIVAEEVRPPGLLLGGCSIHIQPPQVEVFFAHSIQCFVRVECF